MDRYAKALAHRALVGKVCEAELVSRLTLPDGTLQEITHTRRAVCKKWVRQPGKTILTFADVDLSALERIFPFGTFTVADFPELYIDHVGWRVPEGVGTVTKVPLAWIKKTGGTWRYAGVNNALSPAVLAVYRGTAPGQGSVVNPAEYTVSSAVGSAGGVSVITIDFTREQIDFQGKPYVIEADFAIAGIAPLFGGGYSGMVRTAAHELARILTAYGIAYDAASFLAAGANDSPDNAGFVMDALYGYREKGRSGIAIIQDLLALGRAWLSPTATGAWSIVQDVAKASTWQFDTAIPSDNFKIEEYGDGEIPKTVSLDYRPATSGLEDYAGHLSRTTVGAIGELRLANPYMRDHLVADKYLSYWQKRLNTLRVATATAHAAQLANGEAIDVTDAVAYTGTKKFIASGISRPVDRNRLRLREYDAAIYVHTAGELPAGATNVYAPDYSYTLPAAPTALTVVSQGTTVDTDGKLKAHALIRATPPAVNWQRIIVQVKDLTTNEVYQAQLALNAGNYEATLGGMSPGRNHEVRAWAVNANNLDGTITAAVNFTSATSANAPSAVTLTGAQNSARKVNLTWPKATPGAGSTPVKEYIIIRKAGAGSFAEHDRTDATWYDDSRVAFGTAYQYKVQAVDRNENVGADSNTVTVTPQALIYDPWLVNQGVNGVSIGNGSINQGRTSTSTGSASGTISAGTYITVAADSHAYQVGAFGDTFQRATLTTAVGSPTDVGNIGLYNPHGSSTTYDVRWRYTNT